MLDDELDDIHKAIGAGQYAEAEALCAAALGRHGPAAALLVARGVCRLQSGDAAGAEASFRAAARSAPRDPLPLANLALLLLREGRAEGAVAAAERAWSLQSGLPGLAKLRGDALAAAGRHADALRAYDDALRRTPRSFELHNNRGNSLRALGRAALALADFERAIALAPTEAAPYSNCAAALLMLNRSTEAVQRAEHALKLAPGLADAWTHLGNARLDRGEFATACDSLQRAVKLAPGNLQAAHNLGLALQLLGRHADAAAVFARLRERQPDYPYVAGHLAASLAHGCDWSALRELTGAIIEGVRARQPVCDPYTLLTLVDDPALHRACAEDYAGREHPAAAQAAPPRRSRPPGRIRLAYVSGDFHDHATMRLLAQLLECHDRRRFELFAFSHGIDDGSPMHARVRTTFDEFIDGRTLDDGAAARLLRERQIDIAVDLKGYTQGSRLGLFAHRAAPVQAAWLGYPGTTGAPYIDYLIADAVVVPPAQRAQYTEAVAYLPHCYQPNDDRRPRPSGRLTRAAAGLSDDAFVLCCFNSVHKISGDCFASWMRLLRALPQAVLWLLGDEGEAPGRLRAAAAAQSVDPARLVFAPRTDPASYMDRYAVADLFLDTWPYNAHTTASDSLWAGLPVVTRTGASFAGRVATSLLQAAGLPELCADDTAAYEATALHYATDTAFRAQLRRRLGPAAPTPPLFDTVRLCAHLEQAFEHMHARAQAGEPPCDLWCDAQPAATSNPAGGAPETAVSHIR
jgi:predicted O-linked N-acetylglucosamine transferase (SPINDLY family)